MSPLSQLVERYSNILIPPPAVGPGVCSTCRRNSGDWPRCWQCNEHRKSAGDELADLVMPISLAVKGTQLAHVLWSYKHSLREEVKRRFTHELAAVLAAFLSHHWTCLGPIDLVAVVPSTHQRVGRQPVEVLVGKAAITNRLFTNALTTTCENSRRLRPECYSVHGDLTGKSVLLVDDTWTSGASLQSCAVALKRADAARVVGLTIGRHIDPGDEGTKGYLREVRSSSFDWNKCCCCQQD